MPTRETAKKEKSDKAKKASSLTPAAMEDSSGELLAKLANAGVTAEERWKMISEMAYYRAQQRGFSPGGHEQDWLEAESIIDERLSQGALKSGITHH